MAMKIAIIETGRPPEQIRSQHPSYPQMFERLIGERGSFSVLFIPAHDGATLPSTSDFDGLLITGSPAGVYEGHDWIAPLEELVRKSAIANKPQVGICFGHQLMAQAFGGKVEKSDRGWGVGVHTYNVTKPKDWMNPAIGRIACAVSHQDQVIDAPAGAEVLAGSDFCRNGTLSYAQGPAISFQMHPEFGHDFATDLINIRRNRIPADIAETGLTSLKGKSDRGTISDWIVNFFNCHR